MLSFPKTVQLMHRPHLITQRGALECLARIENLDARFHERPGASLNLLQRLASAVGGKRPSAMEDDDDGPRKEPTKPRAYSPMWLGPVEAEGDFGWTLKDGVALLSIDTPLAENGFGFCGTWFHGYDTIQAAIEEMDADDRVKAMFIRWDSPGGVVAPGIYDLTAFLQSRGREAKENAKPIWSYCDMAASASYWLPSNTDHLVAPGVGLVGSIGAVFTHISQADAMNRAGYKATAIQFGKHKTDGASWKDLDEEAAAHMQAVIDDLGEDFLAAVEAGRGQKLTAEAARATEARVFQAQHRDPEHSGIARGFVDAIQPQREAFAALVAETRKGPALSIRPAAKADVKPAAIAAPTEEEDDMKTRAQIAAILAAPATAQTAQEKLDAIADIVNTPSDDEDEEVDDETSDEPVAEEEDEEEAEASATAPAPKKKAAAVDPAVAQKILSLPEAKGREALAQRLAFKPGMTVAEAKADLLAAPKKSALADRVPDPDLSADGGPAPTAAQKSREAAFANAGVRIRKRG